MTLDEAAKAYREAHRVHEKASSTHRKKWVDHPREVTESRKLEQELAQLQKNILDLQDKMLGRTRAYPKRGQWRRLKELQAKVEPLEKRIEQAKQKEHEDFQACLKSGRELSLLGNEVLRLGDKVLEIALLDPP